MRTRVHNNAGSEAVIRESFQLNIDAPWSRRGGRGLKNPTYDRYDVSQLLYPIDSLV